MTTSVPPTKAPAPWVDSQRQADTKALEMGFASMGIAPGGVKFEEVRVPNLSVSSVSTGDGSVGSVGGSGSGSLKFQPPGTPPSISRNVGGGVHGSATNSLPGGELSKTNPVGSALQNRLESGPCFPSPIGKGTSFARAGMAGSPQEPLNSASLNLEGGEGTGLSTSLPLFLENEGIPNEKSVGDVRESLVSEDSLQTSASNSRSTLSKAPSCAENEGSLFEGVRLNSSPASNRSDRVPLSHVKNSNSEEPGSPSIIDARQSKVVGELFRPGSFDDENGVGLPSNNRQPFTRSRAQSSPGPIELSRIGYIGGSANVHLGSNSPSASSFSNTWDGQGNDGDSQFSSNLQFRNFAAGHIPELTTTEGGGISSTGFFGGLRRGTSLSGSTFQMKQPLGDSNKQRNVDSGVNGIWPSNVDCNSTGVNHASDLLQETNLPKRAGSDGDAQYDMPAYDGSHFAESPRVVGPRDYVRGKVGRSASFGYGANDYIRQQDPSDQSARGRGSMMSGRNEPGNPHPQLQHALSDIGARSGGGGMSALGGSNMSFVDAPMGQHRGGGVAPMRGRSFTDGNLVDHQDHLFESGRDRGRFPTLSFQGEGNRFSSANFGNVPSGFDEVPRRRTMSTGDTVSSHMTSLHGAPYQGQNGNDLHPAQYRYQPQQQMQLQANQLQTHPHLQAHPQMPGHSQMGVHPQMQMPAQTQTPTPVHFQGHGGNTQVLEHRESQFHGSSHQVAHLPPHSYGSSMVGVRGTIGEYGPHEDGGQLQHRHHEMLYEAGGRPHQLQQRQVYVPDVGENHLMQGRQGRGFPPGRGSLVLSRSVSVPGMIESHRDMMVDARTGGAYFRSLRQQTLLVGGEDVFNGHGNQNNPSPAGIYQGHHNLQALHARDNAANGPDVMGSDPRFLPGRLSPTRSITHVSQVHAVGCVSSPSRQDRAISYPHDPVVDVRHRTLSADGMGTKVSSLQKLENLEDGAMLAPVMTMQHSDVGAGIHQSPHMNSRSISSISSSSSSIEQGGMLPQYRAAGDSSVACLPVSAGQLPRLVFNVKFKRTQRSFILGPRAPRDVKVGCYVKVEADRGEDLGIVVSRVPADKFNIATRPSFRLSGSSTDASSGGAADLKKIIRRATHDEINLLVEKREEEENLLKVCRAKVKQRGLTMNVVDAEYQFDRHKLIFFFEAEGRIDFRELVRDLFSIYKTRIWMQQLDKGGNSSVTGSTGGCSGGGSLDGQDPIE